MAQEQVPGTTTPGRRRKRAVLALGILVAVALAAAAFVRRDVADPLEPWSSHFTYDETIYSRDVARPVPGYVSSRRVGLQSIEQKDFHQQLAANLENEGGWKWLSTMEAAGFSNYKDRPPGLSVKYRQDGSKPGEHIVIRNAKDGVTTVKLQWDRKLTKWEVWMVRLRTLSDPFAPK